MGVIIGDIVPGENDRGARRRIEQGLELAINARILGDYYQDMFGPFRILAQVTVPVDEEVPVAGIHRQNNRKGWFYWKSLNVPVS